MGDSKKMAQRGPSPKRPRKNQGTYLTKNIF